jgi:hypothetical protein
MGSNAEANGAGKRHDLDRAGPSFPECGRGGVGRSAGRIDVVDERNAGWNAAVREEGARDVPAPLMLRQPSLARRPSCSRQEWPERKLPLGGKLARQPLGRVVSPLQPAVRIARDEDDTRGVRSRHRLTDDRRGPAGEPAQAALLPGDDDRTQPVVVRQHGPSMHKGESPPGALSTAEYGPGRRCAAARAERRLDAAQCRGATVADLRSRERADEAALRQEQIEHATTLGQRV